MVVPVPQDDPGRSPRPGTVRSRPTWSASAAPTSRAEPRRLHLPASRRLDGAASSKRSTCATSRSSARTGAALIGLRLVAEHPRSLRSRRRRQTASCRPAISRPATRSSRGRTTRRRRPNFHVGGIINGGPSATCPEDVIAAYDAPFPDDTLQGGRAPVPDARADVARRSRRRPPTARRGRCSSKLDRSRSSRAFSDSDPITARRRPQ